MKENDERDLLMEGRWKDVWVSMGFGFHGWIGILRHMGLIEISDVDTNRAYTAYGKSKVLWDAGWNWKKIREAHGWYEWYLERCAGGGCADSDLYDLSVQGVVQGGVYDEAN